MYTACEDPTYQIALHAEQTAFGALRKAYPNGSPPDAPEYLAWLKADDAKLAAWIRADRRASNAYTRLG